MSRRTKLVLFVIPISALSVGSLKNVNFQFWVYSFKYVFTIKAHSGASHGAWGALPPRPTNITTSQNTSATSIFNPDYAPFCTSKSIGLLTCFDAVLTRRPLPSETFEEMNESLGSRDLVT